MNLVVVVVVLKICRPVRVRGEPLRTSPTNSPGFSTYVVYSKLLATRDTIQGVNSTISEERVSDGC